MSNLKVDFYPTYKILTHLTQTQTLQVKLQTNYFTLTVKFKTVSNQGFIAIQTSIGFIQTVYLRFLFHFLGVHL